MMHRKKGTNDAQEKTDEKIALRPADRLAALVRGPAPGEAAEVTGTFDSRVYQSRQFFRIN